MEVSADGIAPGSGQLIYDTPSPLSARAAFSTPSTPGIFLPQKGKVILPRVLKYGDELPLFHLEYETPVSYFKKHSILLKVAPDPSDKLYMLLPQNPVKPFMLSESGKFSMHTLKDIVTSSHREGKCLGRALTLENLSVSSIGTFKLSDTSQVGEQGFSISGQIADFTALHSVIITILESLYGNTIVADLPEDFRNYLVGLLGVKDPENESYIVENHPALLPACTYALAFLKMYGFFMDEGCGLLHTSGKIAINLLSYAPYTNRYNPLENWVEMVKNDPWLSKWMIKKHQYYQVNNPRHLLSFPRNAFCHSLRYRHQAAGTTEIHPAYPIPVRPPAHGNPDPQTPYKSEAVSVLVQHMFPLLLTFLVKTAYERCISVQNYDEIDSWGLNDLFVGVKPCFVR